MRIWPVNCNNGGPTERALIISLCLLCSLSLPYVCRPNDEIAVELVSWASVLSAATIFRKQERACFPFQRTGHDYLRRRTLWFTAAGIAAACACRSSSDIGDIQPARTPLLLALTQLVLGYGIHGVETPLPALVQWTITIPGSILVATITILPVLRQTGFEAVLPIIGSILFDAVALIGLSRCYDHLKEHGDNLTNMAASSAAQLVQELACFLIAILFPLCILQSWLQNWQWQRDTATIVLAGLLKGFRQVALCYLATISGRSCWIWTAATTMDTYGFRLSSKDFIATSVMDSLHRGVVGTLSIVQTGVLLLRDTQRLRLFAVWAVLPWCTLLYRSTATEATELISHIFAPKMLSSAHPVSQLVQQAQKSFLTLQRGQSSTYKDAVSAYTARHGLPPPPGFYDWYDFATDHASVLIDEYNTITSNLAPFRKLNGTEYLDAVSIVRSSDIHSCDIIARTLHGSCEAVESLLSPILDKLPDVTLLINQKDEPRLLLNPSARPSLVDRKDPLRFVDISHTASWQTMTKYCVQEGKHPYGLGSDDISSNLPFVRDQPSSMDICRSPHYANLHGFFSSPSTLRYTDQFVPILSSAAPTAFSDILYPAPAYGDPTFMFENVSETAWAEKEPVLYWAGSTTGSWAERGDWRNHHRQRFVELTNGLPPWSGYRYLKHRSRPPYDWELVSTTFLDKSHYNVSFTAIIQCSQHECVAENDFFGPEPRAGKDESIKAQLNFDLDGNGMSGRFYRLLATNSLTMKQTIFREWHDERLFPWVHYVPVGLELEELPELVRFFLEDEAGREIASSIAAEGRKWHNKALRKVDQTIYLYRLLLEMARLQDPTRVADR